MIAALSCDGDADDDDDDDDDEDGSITIMMVTMMVVLDEVWHAPHVVVWHHCLASCRACSGGRPGC